MHVCVEIVSMRTMYGGCKHWGKSRADVLNCIRNHNDSRVCAHGSDHREEQKRKLMMIGIDIIIVIVNES